MKCVIDKYIDKIIKITDDDNPSSLESGLDLMNLIVNNDSLAFGDRSVLLLRGLVEKCYACSKTPVKIKSLELIYQLFEKVNPKLRLKFYECFKTIFQYSVGKRK